MKPSHARLRPADRVYLIADTARATRPLATIVEAACAAGLRLIQVRDKDLDDEAYVARVQAAAGIASRHEARVLLNGRWSLLPATGADGVHVPSSLSVADARAAAGAGSLIGHSAHNRDEVRAASEGGADFVTLSPVFPTESKPGAPALGIGAFAALAEESALPVFALGGVTARNASSCIAAGAFGVAVCGDILRADDPALATRRLLEAVQ